MGCWASRYWNSHVDVNFDFAGTVDFTRLGSVVGRDVGSAAASRSPAPAASTGSIPWSACGCAISSRLPTKSWCAAT